MNDMQKSLFTNDNVTDNKVEEKIFTKADRNGRVSYIEREVDKFDYDGFEVVRREMFSKANCPAVTFKYGSVLFNVRAIRKLNECRFIHILINNKERKIIVKPCDEDDNNSLQWSRVDKREKVVSRTITGKIFTAQLYKDMNWDERSTIKVLGTLLKCRDEKIFVFDLINAEAYLRLSEPSADDPKRRKRVPFTQEHYMPEHWQGNYGQSYEESKKQIVTTFEGVPDGFVKVTIPKLQFKKYDKDSSNENLKEQKEDGTI